MLIAGIWRTHSATEIEARICARPVRHQALIVLASLALLLGLSLVAAQFGWIGMLIFWFAVILLAN